MRRAIITALVVITAATALVAPTAAATPAPPPEPPYAGCSDWSLQSWYPMSQDEPRWVFQCEEGYVDENLSGTWIANLYYWNPESSTVTWYGISLISDGWFWSCLLYPDGVGACGA